MAVEIWLALACVLVAGMQIGFLFLEAGFVRSKNSINVSMKNLADFVVAVLAFHIVGAAIMFGPGFGLIGFDASLMGYSGSGSVTLFLLFQALFCGTAATIVSGAIAERLRFSAYVLLTLPLTALIYPIVGHWAWASLLPGGTGKGWLETLGFIDFAGSSVVHLAGGAAALAILLVVGARSGRFDNETGDELSDDVRTIHGHSPILAGAGALVLLVGWLGFNTGTLEPGSDQFARALSNTLLAGAAAACAATVVGFYKDGYYRADRMINGLLVGLVTVTASAPFAISLGAIGAAALAAGLAVFFTDWLERTHRVDDAVYAVSVHGFGGFFGTIAVPFIVPSEAMANGFFAQLGVQILGAVSIGGFTFLAMGTAAHFMHSRGKLRVSLDDEQRGLNLSEHRAMLGNAELSRTLQQINRGDADLDTRIDVDPFEEGGDIAAELNAFLDRVQATERVAADRLRAEQRELAHMAERERARADTTSELLTDFQREFAELVTQLNTQARDLSRGSEQLATNAQQSGELVGHASDQADAALSIAEQMAQGAQLLADTLELVGRRVEDANTAVGHADQASDRGAQIAGQLEVSANEIGKLVALIKAISDKTGLLALNARIEAANAGDAGKGFTVVSTEVAALSKQTEEASSEIATIVGSLSGLIGESIAQFRAIDASIETVGEMAAVAASSVEEQRATSTNLSDLIEGVRRKAIDSGSAVAQVSENFAQSGETIDRIDNSSGQLENLATRIEAEVEALRLKLSNGGAAQEPAE